MGNARLAVIDAYDHNVDSTCAARLRERYLIDLELPPPGTTCPTDRASWSG
ncbi:hypothetical protein NDR87_36130 [Nocardia sp. CDC159]|uniref:hypothetical protein n=1 Tax=Nocardia TaxID=1817 RepID=UPI00207479A5|nr:hypothetical protein [Nocardia sp. CDC159]